MILREWEIWNTYSAYFDSGIPELHEAASLLVRSRLAPACVLADGRVYWWHSGKVKWAQSTISANASTGSMTLSIPEASGLGGYALEGVCQAAAMLRKELDLFGPTAPLLRPHLRALLQRCHLKSEEFDLGVYPLLKLYGNGIISVEVRIIGPNRQVGLNEFIRDYVNLPFAGHDAVGVPPALAKLAPRVSDRRVRKSLRHRVRSVRQARVHDSEVTKQTRIENSSDFQFELAPLARDDSHQREALSDLALTIISSVGYVLSKPRESLRFLILGPKPTLEIGPRWVARPHIHLIRHVGQEESASANEARYRDAFGWILARTAGHPRELGRRFLPKSGRAFEDFSAYINSAASLWVQAGQGLKRVKKEDADPNRGEFIYENQVKTELLDYGYILARWLSDRVSNSSYSSDAVLSLRRTLAKLEAEMNDVSRFGELKDFLLAGWEAMGVGRIRESIVKTLAIAEAEAALSAARRESRWRTGLSVLFGVAVVPRLAADVLQPLCRVLGLSIPQDANAQLLYFNSIAALGVAVVLLIIHRFRPFRKKPQSKYGVEGQRPVGLRWTRFGTPRAPLHTLS